MNLALTKVVTIKKSNIKDTGQKTQDAKPVLVVIAGPTASGKTKTAIQLAQHFQTEIISADARQFYREMNIGTAKPSEEELRTVTHHFINSISVHDDYNAGKYETEALKVLKDIFHGKKIAVLVGGSGLFLRAVTDGLDDLPSGDEKIREELNELLKKKGIEALQELLKEKDSEYYSMVDTKNPRRLMRALEVYLSTGKPFSSFHSKRQGAHANTAETQQNKRDFVTVKIGLQLEKEKLYKRINQRVDEMMKSGLLDEVKKLFSLRHLNALHTVGYTELFDYLEGKMNLEQAVDKIKQHTRNYAKRQMTWFKKEDNITWFEAEDLKGIKNFIDKKLARNSSE